MAEETNQIIVPSSAGEVITGGKALQQVRGAFTTAVAVQKPRELKEVQRRCIEEAELAGDLFYYGWAVRDKEGKLSRIEGPSINLANALVRNFGNCAVENMPVQETANSWIFTTAFVDFETGFTLTRQFRMDKQFPVYGKMDRYRKDDVRFQIGQSKATRNVVLNAGPASIIDKMMEVAKQSVRSKIEERIKKDGIGKVKDSIAKAFERYGISLERIEEKIELDFKAWDAETLTILSGDLKALERGNETADSLYPEKSEEKDDHGNGNHLSEDQMKTGDPANHQGYESEKKGKAKPGQKDMRF